MSSQETILSPKRFANVPDWQRASIRKLTLSGFIVVTAATIVAAAFQWLTHSTAEAMVSLSTAWLVAFILIIQLRIVAGFAMLKCILMTPHSRFHQTIEDRVVS